jgi:undecaprenyl-diphosphatase
MDIAILLGLQDFRNGSGAFLAEFMKKATFFGELNTTMVIFAILFWCIHKELGSFLMMGWGMNRLVNGALKITACAYRPWIRDPRIVPYGDSMTTATGYSFPSGHTMNAATLFGGIAVKKDFPWALRITSLVAVLLVGFSRLFLGVHTPQDVLIGTIAGILVMWLTGKMMQWIDAHPGKDWVVVCIGIVLSVLLAIYAALKRYPEDYDAAGKLIVDGAKMANDTFKGIGWAMGFLVGWILERRFVGFTTEEISLPTRLMRCVTGLIGFYLVSLILVSLIKNWLPGPAGSVISCFIQMLFISFLFPWLFTYFEKRGSMKAASIQSSK